MSAGVDPIYFLISHLIEGLILTILQAMLYALYAVLFLLNNKVWDTIVLILFLLVTTGCSGLVFGIFCSTLFESSLGSFMFVQFSSIPVFVISGGFLFFLKLFGSLSIFLHTITIEYLHR